MIAASFARIFFRNAVNIGLPVFEWPEVSADVEMGDTLEVNLSLREIVSLTRGTVYHATPYPQFMQDFLAHGGVLNYARKRLQDSSERP